MQRRDFVRGAVLLPPLAGGASERVEPARPDGKTLHADGFDLTKPACQWEAAAASHMIFDPTGPQGGCYRLEPRKDGREISEDSAGTVPILPNRTYLVSALLDCDFDRPSEINIGVRAMDPAGRYSLWHLNGVPNRTDGWKRWQWEFTSDARSVHGRFALQIYDFLNNGRLRIADLSLIELPQAQLRSYAQGEGVSFRGTPGKLPMWVEKVSEDARKIEVVTTGAVFTFNTANQNIDMRQRIDRERDIATWHSSAGLKGLTVLRKSATEVVLANENITLGVQCDSLLMVAPHRETLLQCQSQIGGRWNRLAYGHLLALDDYGGIAANPDIPGGTGRSPRLWTGVEPGRVVAGGLDFSGVYDNQTFLSSAKPGWRVDWRLSPGERLAISVFPPRPFDWKESFHMTFAIAERSSPTERFAEWGKYAEVLILWDFTQRSWAMSWGRDYVPYDRELREYVAAAKKAHMRPIVYMSPYYYYSRDPWEIVGQAKKLRDQYGIEGVYYDGLPSSEWLVGYEQIRLTREVFPDGVIILHTTGHCYDGGAPLGEASVFIPAIDTYANATYRGELVYGNGRDWAYPRYVSSQYRKANCIGVMKSDKWEGLTPIEREFVNLHYNGRANLLPPDYEGAPPPDRLEQMKREYFPILRNLEKLWQEKGDATDFYERYYLPRVRELTKGVGPGST